MTIAQTITDGLKQFSFGQTCYIRVSTEVGGNPALRIAGTISYTDYLLNHVPVRYRVYRGSVLSGETELGDYKVIIMYGSEFTDAIANAMTELIVGGTYSPITRKVTGGKVYKILRSTIVKQYYDDNTPCGVEFIAGLRE